MTASAEQEVQDEPEELRIEKEASERLLIFDLVRAISHDDMRARYAAISDRPKGLTTRPRQ
jgi:antitoxin StbD